ncbi:hypothetical protein E8E14_010845 [Neopestalotiopsis sp. 37M]|nr:hypothetical protein E8E14_010845 [Neopestalotiopsis sp. 37M]
MSNYRVEGCTVLDAAGLAQNNMSAFWTDPTWILVWEKGRTLESIIEACTKRMPNNLLNDRAHKRHLKAVDTETGAIVGYARFLVPDRLAGDWLKAQTPDVSETDKKKFDELFATADWTFRRGTGNIDEPVHPIMEKYKSRKEYMELEYLAVQPDYRNRGIATMLMQAGIAESERMGIDIFMLAYKAGLGVYKRLGFETLETLILDDSAYGGQGEYGCYFMERTVKR